MKVVWWLVGGGGFEATRSEGIWPFAFLDHTNEHGEHFLSIFALLDHTNEQVEHFLQIFLKLLLLL